jgi:uncharacterized membrane protein YraQ (UPF0718 family)
MSFVIAFAFVAGLTAVLAGIAGRRRPEAHREAATAARGYFHNIAPRLPFALVAAECLGRLLPPEVVSAWIGAGTGFTGVLIASGVGAALPGGPMLAFPLAIALLRAGAGPEALVALITAWSLVAINRTLLFELPLLGTRFTAWRLAVCSPLSIIAGLLAALLMSQGMPH